VSETLAQMVVVLATVIAVAVIAWMKDDAE
jgi:hypothetical protein